MKGGNLNGYYKSNLERLNRELIDCVKQFEAVGINYSGSTGQSSEASIIQQTQNALDSANSESSETWARLAEQYAELADSAGAAANDIEGMIAQIGATGTDLDKTFAKITDLLNMEIQESKQIKNKNNITETIQLLEQRLNRMLRIDELERIKTWYEDFSYVHQNIIDAINAIDRGVTILKIEKLLNIDINEDEAIDPDIEASLERIFKKL